MVPLAGDRVVPELMRHLPRLSQSLVCALLLTAGTIADIFGPQPYTGLPLLAAAPLMAGALLSFHGALFFAVTACALSIVLDLYLKRPAIALSVDLADIAAIGVLALLVNFMLQRQRRQLVRAYDVAEAAQRAILPELPAAAGPLQVAARYEAALAEARIGGDLYAIQPTPFGVRALIGDVRGKGLQAVATVSVAIGAFRQEAENTPSLADLAQRLDKALCRESRRGSGPEDLKGAEDFTTALLVEFSEDGTEVRLVNRGHPGPYLVHAGTVRRLDPGTDRLPLGICLPVPDDEAPAVDTVALPHDAFLLLITDGVIEARNEHGTFYDPTTGGLTTGGYRYPGEVADALLADVNRWVGGRPEDDVAVVVFCRHPERTAAPS